MKKLLTVALAASLTLASIPAFGQPAKPGEACVQIGQVVKYKKSQITCTSKGSKTLWAKGKSAAKKYQPIGYSGSRCQEDSKVTGVGANIQAYGASFGRCVGPMRLVYAGESKLKPITSLSSTSDYQPITQCKKLNTEPAQSWKGFPSESRKQQFALERHPAPGTRMQVIPIFSPDAPKTSASPSQDYKFYFDFILNYFDYINDGGSKFELNVPDEYLFFPKNIGSYEIKHGKDDEKSKQFANDVISAVDSKFDFSKIDYVLFVVPAGTPSSVIGQQGFGDVVSAEGRLFNVAVAQPATFTSKDNSKTPEMALPIMWLHEFYHPGLNLGDNHAGDSRSYDEERGMGDWGLMSRSSGDLLVWQKWLLGFLQDSQVHCLADLSTTTTTLLTPSTTKSVRHKQLTISIGATRVLVVESIRATGINYKLGRQSLGALVYLVDTSQPGHEDGYTLLYPDNRRPVPSRPFMTDAPLKLGESLTYEGVKITNVEWGEFGDVIRVEPVN